MSFNKHDIKNKKLSEADLANRKMGDNDLQGDDQLNVRNQRHAVPDTKLDTDGIVESLENSTRMCAPGVTWARATALQNSLSAGSQPDCMFQIRGASVPSGA
jgi:hypothetical protein